MKQAFLLQVWTEPPSTEPKIANLLRVSIRCIKHEEVLKLILEFLIQDAAMKTCWVKSLS